MFGGSSEYTCGKYTWVKELLNLRTEIQEQMGRLRSIREFEEGEPGTRREPKRQRDMKTGFISDMQQMPSLPASPHLHRCEALELTVKVNYDVDDGPPGL